VPQHLCPRGSSPRVVLHPSCLTSRGHLGVKEWGFSAPKMIGDNSKHIILTHHYQKNLPPPSHILCSHRHGHCRRGEGEHTVAWEECTITHIANDVYVCIVIMYNHCIDDNVPHTTPHRYVCPLNHNSQTTQHAITLHTSHHTPPQHIVHIHIYHTHTSSNEISL